MEQYRTLSKYTFETHVNFFENIKMKFLFYIKLILPCKKNNENNKRKQLKTKEQRLLESILESTLSTEQQNCNSVWSKIYAGRSESVSHWTKSSNEKYVAVRIWVQ
jgi:hypothetical protein